MKPLTDFNDLAALKGTDEVKKQVVEGLKVSSLKIIDPTTLQGQAIPERRWVLKDWIPEGYPTSLYGDGGTGKSLLAMMLMVSCALSKDFLGMETKSCRVFGVFCEDDEAELHFRQANILKHYGCEFADLSNMRYISRVGDNNILMNFEHNNEGKITEFFYQIEEAAKDFRSELIIIDTAADTFGGNENIRPQVRQYISACLTRLAKSINGTVLLCAHPSQAGLNSGHGGGGSTAWNNSVRSRLYLSRLEKDKNEEQSVEELNSFRILSKKKANYSTIGDDITIEYKDGVFVKKFEAPADIMNGFEINNKLRAAEKAFLQALDNFTKQGRNLSASPTAGNYAPKQVMSDPACTGFNKKEMAAAMNRLFHDNKIVFETYGKPSKPCKRIALVTVGVVCSVTAGNGYDESG